MCFGVELQRDGVGNGESDRVLNAHLWETDHFNFNSIRRNRRNRAEGRTTGRCNRIHDGNGQRTRNGLEYVRKRVKQSGEPSLKRCRSSQIISRS